MNFFEKERKNTISKIAALSIASVLLLLLVFKIVSLNASLSPVQQQLLLDIQVSEQKLKKLKEIQPNEAEIKEIIATYERRLPKTADQVDFINKINGFSQDYSVVVDSVVFEDVNIAEKYKSLPVQVKVLGKYIDVMRFIEDIDFNEQITVINKFDIKKENNEEDNIVAIVNLSVFFQ